MPPIWVEVGGRYVRLERYARSSRRYDAWDLAMACGGGLLLGVMGLAAVV